MHEKQERISAAAALLFRQHGFEAVTVAQIAEAADVAEGTLFRYASSKAELLLMVYNAEFGDAIQQGTVRAEGVPDPTEAVLAMLDPIVASAAKQPGNAVVYQRELMFGAPGERYRAEGLALVARLERAIAACLTRGCPHGGADDADDAEGVQRAGERAARTIFATLHLLLARPSTGADWGVDCLEEFRQQIVQIVCGFVVTSRPADPSRQDQTGDTA